MQLNQSITTDSQSVSSHSDNCTRCHGLLVHVDFMDMLQGGFLWGNGMRCINCGWIVDRVIHTNQQDRPIEKLRKRRSRTTPKPVAA